jgi:hypothetical protein
MTASTVSLNISPELERDLRRWRGLAILTGGVAAALMVAGALFRPDQFFRSYLWAYMFIVGLPGGCLAWLMLQYLTGGAWGVVVRRVCEAAVRTLPLVALLFIPLALGIPRLYQWSHPEIVAHDELLRHKQAYLNLPFFLIRAAVYLGGWILLSWRLNHWSAEEDRGAGPVAHSRMARLSGPGLVFWGFSLTFLSIDWVLSINPHWFSTIYGMLFMAGQGLSSLAFLITVLVLFSSRRPYSEILTARHLHDLGKLLLALVMVWAYFAFSQFLIIWAGNLPEEIPWYLERLRGGWEIVGVMLVFLHFGLPFLLLLSRDLKRNFKLLAGVAVFIIFMRLVDLYWQVAPSFSKGHFTLSWMDIAAPIALTGIWLWSFLGNMMGRPVLPVNEPHLEEAHQHGRE